MKSLRASTGSPGFSVLEVLIAFVILGLALLPVIGLFTTSGQQARQTADYGLAISLNEKVAEDLRLANWENIHLTEQIKATPGFNTESPVVDGKSRFFASVEDGQQPWGEIVDGVDPGIDPSFGTLYRSLKSFSLGASNKPITLVTGTALDITLNMAWSDFQQKKQTLPLEVRLAGYGSWVARPQQVEERAQADDEIRKLMYPTRTGMTLSAVVASGGGDLAMIRNVGDVSLLVKAFMDSIDNFDAQIAQAKTALNGATGLDKARASLAIARLWERRCAVCLQILHYVADPLNSLADFFTTDKLGSPKPDPTQYASYFLDIDYVFNGFRTTLYQALANYVTTYNAPLGPMLTPRLRIRLFMKILELYKLQVVTAESADITPLQSMLDQFIAFERGRNPNFAAFAALEREHCASVETLRAHYPADRYRAVEDAHDSALEAIKKVIGQTPPGAYVPAADLTDSGSSTNTTT